MPSEDSVMVGQTCFGGRLPGSWNRPFLRRPLINKGACAICPRDQLRLLYGSLNAPRAQECRFLLFLSKSPSSHEFRNLKSTKFENSMFLR